MGYNASVTGCNDDLLQLTEIALTKSQSLEFTITWLWFKHDKSICLQFDSITLLNYTFLTLHLSDYGINRYNIVFIINIH